MINYNKYFNLMRADLEELEKADIDVESILLNIHILITNNKFLCCNVGKYNKNYNSLEYNVGLEVKEHTALYINLGYGYPKEIMFGHWCYIYKLIGYSKALVIPLTSLKIENNITTYEMVINSSFNGFNVSNVLNFRDIRVVDLQRVYKKKGVMEIRTPRYLIERKFQEVTK